VPRALLRAQRVARGGNRLDSPVVILNLTARQIRRKLVNRLLQILISRLSGDPRLPLREVAVACFPNVIFSARLVIA
jgi:hypothetical protein